MNKNILVVEDNEQDRKVMHRFLKKAGYNKIIFAEESYQAVKFAHQEKPHLVILDIGLPAGGGLKVLEDMKLSINTKNIPIIIYTGSDSEEVKKKALNHGVNGYLKKSPNPQELLKMIQCIIDEGR